MVFVSIRHGPADGSELTGFNRDAAVGIKGLVGVVESKRWLAVAAETWWSADEALGAMKPKFADSMTRCGA